MNRESRRIALGGVLLLASVVCRADKVIMKDGKIYEGRIMGETQTSVLISSPPYDPHPHFLKYNEILTIVRDSHPVFPTEDTQRVIMVEAALTGNVFSPEIGHLDPAAGLHLAGGLRPHPLIEADAVLDWVPALFGQLAVSDGTNSRSYSRFGAYGGGFSIRLYPFYRMTHAWEPYALGGYQWNRLAMKNSDDFLKGYTWQTGIGVLHAWKAHWYWDFRFLYQRTLYDKVQFLLREGSINEPVHNPTYTLSVGLSYRF